MSFGRQVWECAVEECGKQACVSVIVVVQSPGGRNQRTKANTKAVRLCRSHLWWFAEHQEIKPMGAAIGEAGRKVEPEAWDTPKPKRVK